MENAVDSTVSDQTTHVVYTEAEMRLQLKAQFYRGLDDGYIDKAYEARFGTADRLDYESWTFLGQVNRRLAEKAMLDDFERQQAQPTLPENGCEQDCQDGSPRLTPSPSPEPQTPKSRTRELEDLVINAGDQAYRLREQNDSQAAMIKKLQDVIKRKDHKIAQLNKRLERQAGTDVAQLSKRLERQEGTDGIHEKLKSEMVSELNDAEEEQAPQARPNRADSVAAKSGALPADKEVTERPEVKAAVETTLAALKPLEVVSVKNETPGSPTNEQNTEVTTAISAGKTSTSSTTTPSSSLKRKLETKLEAGGESERPSKKLPT